MLAYLHPVGGAAVLLFLCFVGSQALRGHRSRRGGAAAMTRHARLAPVAYALTIATWLAGSLSTALLRDDLDWADTLHFRCGTLIVVLLTASALTARAMRRGHSGWREVHPWLGAAALLLAAAQAVTGLRIMP